MARKYACIFSFIVLCILLSGYAPVQSEAFTTQDYKIVYESYIDEEPQIFMMDLNDPGMSTQLTFGNYGSKHPTITSNRGRIYYYHWTPTGWGDMNLMYYQDLDEKKEWLVQRNSVHEEEDPSICADGTTLAYLAKMSITTKTGTIPLSDNWEVNCLKTDFSVASRITQTPNDESGPSLNGDGSMVYFAIAVEKQKPKEDEEEDEESAGINLLQDFALADSSIPESIFALAADDRYIQGPVMYPGMGSGGGATTTPKLDDADESSDEDGEDDEEEDDTYNFYYIFRNSFDGENLERVTPREFSAWHPTVDASERWMAFSSDKDGDEEIYLMDLESFEVTRLTENEGYDGVPQISSDGKVIVFVSDRDGDKEIFKIDRDGGNLVQLTDNDYDDVNPDIN